jgi:hypothetical protein
MGHLRQVTDLDWNEGTDVRYWDPIPHMRSLAGTQAHPLRRQALDPDARREWWRDRGRLREWIAAMLRLSGSIGGAVQ